MHTNIFQIERPAAVVVETIDGRAYVGTSLRQALERMRADAWGCPSRTFRGYMLQFARRAFMWAKRPVRTDSIENFVADLEMIGLITIRTLEGKKS